MKKPLLILMVLCAAYLRAQDEVHTEYEVGIPLVTYNFFSTPLHLADRPRTELLNGLFVRMSKKRWAVRLLLNYTNSSEAGEVVVGGARANLAAYKDFRFGVGGQWKFWKLYVFGDAAYRNMSSSGTFSEVEPGYEETYSLGAYGLLAAAGAGVNIRIYKSLQVVPEIGYNMIINNYDVTRINAGGRPKVPVAVDPAFNTVAYKYSDVIFNPFVRILLSVKLN